MFGPAMNRVVTQPPEAAANPGADEFSARLRRLERRDWWHWWSALLVILMLTAGLVVLSFLLLRQENEPFFQLNFSQAVRGLVGVVLLFSLFTIYEQVRMKHLRSQLAEHTERAIKQEMRAEELYRLAMLDPLTGLHNQRFAEERLAAEIARSQRHGSPLAVLMLDLDDFREFNDLHGRAVGDFVLKELAYRLEEATRGSDLAVRLARDEFLVLLPECQPGHAQTVLTRLRPLEVDWQGKTISVAFSVGWTDYQRGESPRELMQRADHALHANKKKSTEKRKHQPTPAR